LNFGFEHWATRETYLREEKLWVEAAGGLAVTTSPESEQGKTKTVRWQHRVDWLGENLGSGEGWKEVKKMKMEGVAGVLNW